MVTSNCLPSTLTCIVIFKLHICDFQSQKQSNRPDDVFVTLCQLQEQCLYFICLFVVCSVALETVMYLRSVHVNEL